MSVYVTFLYASNSAKRARIPAMVSSIVRSACAAMVDVTKDTKPLAIAVYHENNLSYKSLPQKRTQTYRGVTHMTQVKRGIGLSHGMLELETYVMQQSILVQLWN